MASEEHKKTVLITTKNEEEAQIAEQNKERGVAIAQKAREREIAVETERVEKARALEVIGREREVALVGIARDKEVEMQKKEIATVIRDRIAVEKTVAAEEEQIKDVRNSSEATRKKEAVRIAAEAAAQEGLVKQVKAAEASEEAAKFKARERILLADAELDTADKTARAKIRIAEGVQAEAAAEGLAKVRVREADAAAIEKQGLVEAKVTREKLLAEAAGLAQKAESMKLLDGAGRGHEEFRLRLDKEKSVELEKIRARKEVVASQAQILAQAMGNARINIVGGDGQFLERFMSAISMGQSVDGALEQSETLRDLVQGLMNGNGGAGLAEALDKLAPLVTPAAEQRDRGRRSAKTAAALSEPRPWLLSIRSPARRSSKAAATTSFAGACWTTRRSLAGAVTRSMPRAPSCSAGVSSRCSRPTACARRTTACRATW